MAKNLNLVLLVGRLGRDPELKFLADGQAVTTFSLATDRPAKADGKVETDWHRVTCWGKLAEITGEHLGKGRLVCVSGRLQYRSWEGKDGQQRQTTEIVASDVLFLDPKQTNSSDDASDRASSPDA